VRGYLDWKSRRIPERLTLNVKQNVIFAVDIIFADKLLRRSANDHTLCIKRLGAERAELYQRRLGALRAATSLEDLRNMPGRFHSLTSDRKGQWACNLGHPYRLIFEPVMSDVSTNPDGTSEASVVSAVRIVEIIDYHGN
jgi:proteic killer suppression protein